MAVVRGLRVNPIGFVFVLKFFIVQIFRSGIVILVQFSVSHDIDCSVSSAVVIMSRVQVIHTMGVLKCGTGNFSVVGYVNRC